MTQKNFAYILKLIFWPLKYGYNNMMGQQSYAGYLMCFSNLQINWLLNFRPISNTLQILLLFITAQIMGGIALTA